MEATRFQVIQDEPVDFIEISFNEVLWSKQREIVNSIRDNSRTSVRSCFDAGKSFVSSRVALQFLYSYPNSKVITTAPTFRQVKDILWREIHAAKAKSRVQMGGQLNQTSLNLGNNWFAMGFSSDEPTNFQGFHAERVLVIVDEAAGVEDPVFNSLEGLLTSNDTRLLYIGNPTNITGIFYRSFQIPSFHTVSISAFDTPNFTTFNLTLNDIRNNTWEEKIIGPLPAPYLITPSWVYDKYLNWGEDSPMFQAMIMGQFPQEGEDTLIPLHRVEQAAMRQIIPPADAPESIGVDIARFGTDKTIFYYRKGSAVLDMKEFAKFDTVDVVGHLRTMMGVYPFAQVFIDEVGVGGGVVDMVKKAEQMKTVTGVNVGTSSASPEQFYNLRAQVYWQLRQRFIDGDISIPNDPELKAQLSSIKFEYTFKNQIKIEKKEDMKKRGLPSPDKADALALAFGTIKTKPSLLSYMGSL